MKTLHLFETHAVEVGCTRKGRPSYRWTPGYAQAFTEGRVSMAQPLRKWQAQARRDGDKIKVYASPDAARAAVKKALAGRCA